MVMDTGGGSGGSGFSGGPGPTQGILSRGSSGVQESPPAAEPLVPFSFAGTQYELIVPDQSNEGAPINDGYTPPGPNQYGTAEETPPMNVYNPIRQAYKSAPGTPFQSDFGITIRHLATKKSTKFEGFVKNFSDDFVSTWNEEQVYGRMDPLATFQGTKRNISLQFDVVAGNAMEAWTNNNRLNKLIQFLYPVYESGHRSGQNPITAGPLLELKWTGLITTAGSDRGLVGFLRGVTYDPDLDAGTFIMQNRAGTSAQLVPKVITIQLEFTVLHTHLMGWVPGDEFTFGGEGAGSWSTPRPAFPHAGGGETAAYDLTMQSRFESETERLNRRMNEQVAANTGEILGNRGHGPGDGNYAAAVGASEVHHGDDAGQWDQGWYHEGNVRRVNRNRTRSAADQTSGFGGITTTPGFA